MQRVDAIYIDEVAHMKLKSVVKADPFSSFVLYMLFGLFSLRHNSDETPIQLPVERHDEISILNPY
jgi:hypothetical protein